MDVYNIWRSCLIYTKAFVKHFTYKEAVYGTLSVSSQLSCSCILFTVHYKLEEKLLSSSFLLLILLLLTALMLIFTLLCLNCNDANLITKLDFSKNIKGILLFVLFGYGTSPVLKTLTDTISSDTVFGMSVGMMFLHLAFFDYGLQASIVSGSLSFNAAIFSAVCLASRLHSIFDVFIFLTFAVHIFALLPVFFSKIQSLYKTKLSVQITCTLLVCISANLMLASISLFWTCNLLIVMIIINLVFPYFYVNWQHHKDNIYGPWDEAIIDDEDLKESINKPS